jgi:hypothetical protein
MRALFVPCPSGGPAHFIPLLALSRKLESADIKAAFLLPRSLRQFAAQFRLEVLDVDHQPFGTEGFRSEMRAYKLFSPDVVIDDTGLTTGFATSMMKLPRVTVQRTGVFPHATPRNASHRHSLGGQDADVKQLPDVTFLGLRQPQTLSDLFSADAKIVPGIRSIEVLPPPLATDRTYFFSGPLLAEDWFVEYTEAASSASSSPTPSATSAPLSLSKDFTAVERFLGQHRQRRRVYLTLGTVAQAGSAIRACILHLLERQFAVISNIPVDGLASDVQDRFFCATHLPMHLVCGNIDLMVHQCGSGTYQYSILHEVPAVTVGTRCFDREDVALRLEELGVSIHLPAPEESIDFEARFRDAIGRYFTLDGALLSQSKGRLKALNDEVARTVSAFDFERILRTAASKRSRPATRTT